MSGDYDPLGFLGGNIAASTVALLEVSIYAWDQECNTHRGMRNGRPMIPPEDETNRHLRDCLEESERQYQAKVTEVHGLHDANEALRRDNDDLTAQKDRLIAEKQLLSDQLMRENESLKKRVRELSEANRYEVVTANIKAARAEEEAETLRREHEQFLSIEANNGKLRIENEKLEKKAAFLQQSVNDTAAMNRELQERNYQLEKENETLRQHVASLEAEVGLRAPRTSDRKQNVDDEARLMRLTLDSGARQQAQIDTLIRVLSRVVR